MLKDTEFANLRGAYTYLDIEPLTVQQEHLLMLTMRGMSIKSAANGAGMSASTGYKFINEDPRVPVVREFFRAQMFRDTQISVELLNNMTLEAHRKSASSTEELKAIETLARLNQLGGYAPAQVIKERAEQDRERDITPKSTKELEHMPEHKLLQMAQLEGLEASLDPTPVSERRTPVTLDAEAEEVEQ